MEEQVREFILASRANLLALLKTFKELCGNGMGFAEACTADRKCKMPVRARVSLNNLDNIELERFSTLINFRVRVDYDDSELFPSLANFKLCGSGNANPFA